MERLALALHRRGNRCALWIPGPRAPGCGFPGFGSLERSILRSAEHELGRAFGQLGCCTWGFRYGGLIASRCGREWQSMR